MKLFGRKKKQELITPVNAETQRMVAESQCMIDNMIAKMTNQSQGKTPYQLIEEAISNNPKSALYRVPVQQTSAHFQTIEADRFLELAKRRFVALDLETTGLNEVDDQIVEICAVRVENQRITACYSQLIDPGIPISAEASAVNGITDTMVAGKPRIYEVLPDLLDFIGNDVVAAHNAGFDVRFITQACMRYRFKLHRKYFDTMDLRPYWPGLKNRKLSSFLEAAGITNDNPHRAAGDAQSLARLIIKTIEKYGGVSA